MTIQPFRPHSRVLALLGLLLFCTPLAADSDRKHDHDQAREALRRGEVMPIADILRRLAYEVPGDVIEVEFERKRRQGERIWIYELKILTADGRMLEVKVDAARGNILKMEED